MNQVNAWFRWTNLCIAVGALFTAIASWKIYEESMRIRSVMESTHGLITDMLVSLEDNDVAVRISPTRTQEDDDANDDVVPPEELM